MLLAHPTDIVAEHAFDQRQPPQSLIAHAVAKPTALNSRWPGVEKPMNHAVIAAMTKLRISVRTFVGMRV